MKPLSVTETTFTASVREEEQPEEKNSFVTPDEADDTMLHENNDSDLSVHTGGRPSLL